MSSESAFIMYSSKDSETAHKIAEKLKHAGANIWIDTINLSELGADQDEEEIMETALLNSKVVFILTSGNALNDQFVRNDKRFARENDKKMILVKLEDCDLSKKMRWRNLPLVNYHTNEELAIEKLLDMLKVIKKTSSGQSKNLAKEAEPVSSKEIEKPETVEVLDANPIKSKGKKNIPAEQLAMLNEIKDDIEFYKFKMKEQVKNSKFNMGLGIALAIVILAGAFVIPAFVDAVQDIQDKVQWAGGLIGGGLPTTFSFSSLNNTKEKQKRLDGIQLFERKISRLERGIVPITQNELLTLEDDFSLYINA